MILAISLIILGSFGSGAMIAAAFFLKRKQEDATQKFFREREIEIGKEISRRAL